MREGLELCQLRFAYPDRGEVVRGIDLQLQPGQFHGLLGRSGCGKTTLLKLAAGLLTPSAGQVRLQGRPITAPVAEMGFVFQAPTLLPWRSVRDNVLLPLALHRRIQPADEAQAQALLDALGLAGLQQRLPGELSGGQQSRVALARALITRPSVLFMDEPFAALDAITREELQHDCRRLCKARGCTVLWVTHDIAEAVYLCDAVSLLHQGALHAQWQLDLPAERDRELRYGADVNRWCAQLRHGMDALR